MGSSKRGKQGELCLFQLSARHREKEIATNENLQVFGWQLAAASRAASTIHRVQEERPIERTRSKVEDESNVFVNIKDGVEPPESNGLEYIGRMTDRCGRPWCREDR